MKTSFSRLLNFVFCCCAALVILNQPLFSLGAIEPAESSYSTESGPLQIEISRGRWTDQKRHRDVPWKIYSPKGSGPYPVVIFSHGLGGSRETYEYLGQYWATHGYICVHVQHSGSDSSVWVGVPFSDLQESFQKAAMNLSNITNRPIDIHFAIDQLEAMRKSKSGLGPKLDLHRLGVAGHSFGAFTALAAAGEVLIGMGNLEASFSDSRVKAVIAMSAPIGASRRSLDKSFGSIKVPVYHMTGTLDDSPVGETMAKERRYPYDHIHGGDQYLVTFNGADHMVFSGRGLLPGGGHDELFQDLTKISGLAFWDAYLKNDKSARQWLANGGFEKVLGKNGVFERKTR
jgi:predicted dienelactone hydrolase